jgi:hypothetical protein
MWHEFWEFISTSKNWWLVPPVVIFVIFGVVVFFANTTPVSPFVYMLF